jgi:hypothetical protein
MAGFLRVTTKLSCSTTAENFLINKATNNFRRTCTRSNIILNISVTLWIIQHSSWKYWPLLFKMNQDGSVSWVTAYGVEDRDSISGKAEFTSSLLRQYRLWELPSILSDWHFFSLNVKNRVSGAGVWNVYRFIVMPHFSLLTCCSVSRASLHLPWTD